MSKWVNYNLIKFVYQYHRKNIEIQDGRHLLLPDLRKYQEYVNILRRMMTQLPVYHTKREKFIFLEDAYHCFDNIILESKMAATYLTYR